MMNSVTVGLAACVPAALFMGWKKLNAPIEARALVDLSDPYWAYPFDRFIDYSVGSALSKARVVADAAFGEGWFGGGHWMPVPQEHGCYSPEVRSAKGIPPLLFICSDLEKPVFLKHAALLFPELLNQTDMVIDLDYCSYGEQLMLLSLNKYHGFQLKFCGSWRFDTYYAPLNKLGNEYCLEMPPTPIEGPGIKPAKHFLALNNQLELISKSDDNDKGIFDTNPQVGGVTSTTKVGAIAAGSLAAIAAIYLFSPSLCESYIEKNPSAKNARLLELISNCPTFITTHTKSYGVLFTDRGPRLVGRKIFFSLLQKFKHYKIRGSETLFEAKWKGKLKEGAFISRNLSDDSVVIFDKLAVDTCEATLITDDDVFHIVLVV